MSRPPSSRPHVLDATLAADSADAGEAVATPEPNADTLLGGVDTAQLRNAVQAKIFGTPIEPVRIGRHTVLRRIGRGGMGVVYSAYDDELDRKVAIKLIAPGAEGEDEQLWSRLRREAKALARLSDPAIVQVYEVGEHEGQLYIAMEFVDGITLRQWIAQSQHDAHELVAMFVQAARGLAAAHRAGLVHRDFKPDNAMIGRDGRLRVLDFGLAVGTAAAPQEARDVEAIALDEAQLTRTGALLGTPAYMAPEQINGGVVDARADQFAFCVALFEALWGKRPFEGGTLGELAGAITLGAVVEPTTKLAISTRVRRAVLRGLAADPAERHPAMDALVRELEHRSRIPLLVALVLTLGLVTALAWSWYREATRAEQLDDEVASTRARVEHAEQALDRSADELVLAEARGRLADDPTAALEALQRVEDRERHASESWAIATRASARAPALDEVAIQGAHHLLTLLGDGAHALLRPFPPADGLALLDVDDGELHPLAGHYGAPFAVDAAGKRIVTTRAGIGIELTALPGGEARMVAPDEPTAIELADDAPIAVGLLGDAEAPRRLIVWNLDDRTRRELGNATFVWMVASDGTRALISDAQGHAVVELDTGARREVGGGQATIGHAALDAGVLALDVFGEADGIGTRVVRLADGARLDLPVFGELAFDPGGRVLASGMIGGGPRFVDVAAWEPGALALAGPQDSAAYGVSWSRDGTRMVGCGTTGTCTVWSWPLRRQLATLYGTDGLDDVHIGADDRIIVATKPGGSEAEVHDAQGEALGTFSMRPPETIRTWIVRDPPIAAADLLALGGGTAGLVTLVRGGVVQLWGGKTPRELATIGERGAVALDQAGRIAVLADEAELRVIALADGKERKLALPVADGRRHLELAQGGKQLAVWDATRLTVIDTATMRERWGTGGWHLAAIAGDRLCHAQRSQARLHCVALADGEDGRTHELPAAIEALAASPDGRWLAAALDDGRVGLIELATGTQRARQLTKAPGRSLAFAPDGRVLAIASLDGGLTLWNLVDDAIAEDLLPQASPEGLLELATRRPATQRLAFSDAHTLVVVDAWGGARALDVPPAGDPAALQTWILATTHVRP